ncbi:UDP-N-acetylglucosamine 1-carboxyvinyltransferase [Candidatus Gracilibacteria bacterium]|nr:UDP-N-acetylglucosamine 1-carboxyvinyltransferase [Candidatus Gracilibacteria bacterium]
MSKFIINGGKKLSGEVQISGSKNAALPIICASILFKGTVILKNIPNIADIKTLIKILEFLGAKIKFENNILEINSENLENKFIPIELVHSLRGAILLLGPLLARFGKAEMAQPGGCLIGRRPANAHLNAFSEMGVKILESEKNLRLEVGEKKEKYKFSMSEISVTGTENILSFASYQNFSEISLCASEPHVQDLCHFLEKIGVKIEGIGSHKLKIFGNTSLPFLLKGKKIVEYTITNDYLEIGTFAVAAAITGGNVLIKGAKEGDLDSFWLKMKEAGVKFKHSENEVEIFENDPKKFKPVKIQTGVFPAFPTDLQAPFAILQTIANGEGKIFETLFEKRLNFLFELEQMGARIKIENPHQAIIFGGKKLKGAEVTSCDLRAGAAVVLAGLIADGQSTILNIKYIDRGYENFEEKLKNLGAEIKRKRIS